MEIPPTTISLRSTSDPDFSINAGILSRDLVGKLGGTEGKWRDVLRIKNKPVEFIERHPTSDSVPELGKKDPVGFTIERVNILGRAGIPTPVFYEGDMDGKRVILSENVRPIGGAIYGKSELDRIAQGKIIETDRKFIDLVDHSGRKIFGRDEVEPPEKSLWWWFIHANEKEVLLPSDDAMELVVAPNGDYEWMVLDPAGVATIKELRIDQMELVNRNLESVNKVLDDVRNRIYNAIKLKL